MEGPDSRDRGALARVSVAGGDALAVCGRRQRRGEGLAGQLGERHVLPAATGARPDPARPLLRLQAQPAPLPGLPGDVPEAPVSDSNRVGQERWDFRRGGRHGVPARPAACGACVAGRWALRPGRPPHGSGQPHCALRRSNDSRREQVSERL
jgi:hypothetical protein